MKRIISLFTALFCVLLLTAADLTGVKIYINPGHGGFDSGDRSVATIPFPTAWENPTGFWESASNLTKGLFLRDLLTAQNATVIMSRTENTSADDRPLSVIATEASTNNVDAFLSIHSNAAGATTAVNYLYLMCPGSAGENDQNFRNPQTEALAKACWPHLWNNPLNIWTHYTETSMKIACFVTSYTVIGTSLTAPGFLSEGSFHDYKPETHRLLSEDYRKLEAMRFFYFYTKFFNGTMPSSGIVSGDVRDAHTRMTNSLYLPYISGSKDQWQPINGTVVSLCTPTGTVLKTYTVDNNYNGIFVFWDVAPGNYKLKYTATDYIAQEVDVTVEAGKIKNQNILLTNVNYDPNANRVAPDDFPKPQQDAGAQLPTSFTATPSSSNAAAWLSNKEIRRSIIKGTKMYMLTNDSRIIIANSATGDSITQLNTEGIAGGTRLISDIAFTSDTILLACNQENIPLATSDKFWKVYKWTNETAAPTLLFSTQFQGNWTTGEVGNTFAVSGASWNCKVYTTSITTGSSRQIRILGFEHKDDEGLILKKYMLDPSYTETAWGSNMKFSLSPRGASRLMVDSDIMQLTEYEYNWSAADRSPLINQGSIPTEVVKAGVTGANFFKYAGKQLMITPTVNESSADVGIALYDITNGLGSTSLLWSQAPAATSAALPLPHMLAAGVVAGYDITMTLFAQNKGIEKFQTVITTVANIYASELKMEKLTDSYRFSFTLNENATNVELQFTLNNTVIGTHQAGALTKGVQTIEIPATSIPKAEGSGLFNLNWQVKATALSNIRVSKISNETTPFQFFAPYGVAIDNSTESPYFGRVYLTNSKGGTCSSGRPTTQGIYVLNAALADVTAQNNNSYAGGVSWSTSVSPYRIAVAPDGRLFLCDYSDNHSGIWIADPANLGAPFTELFRGCTRDADGLGTANGTKVHGSSSSCFVMGTGENTVLYVADEDYSLTGSSPNVIQYNIGTATSWTQAPSAVIFDRSVHKLLINTNNKIMPDGRGGWWISQYRAAESAAEPCLVHITGGGIVDFHTGKDLLIKNGRNGGMTVSSDGKRVATCGPSMISVWDVTYEEDGRVASFTSLFTITNTVGGLGANSNDLAFDPAGNLYYISNTTERLVVLSLPKGDNSFVSKAPSTQTIQTEGISTGLSQETKQLRAYAQNGTLFVEAEANERIQVYSLTGICLADVIASDNISTFELNNQQIVIVKAGNRTVKVAM